jgi:hypothetical protein
VLFEQGHSGTCSLISERRKERLKENSKVRAMADGPERQKAMAATLAKYPMRLHARASLERDPDKAAAPRLRDPEGRTRVLLRVAADGTPDMQFLDPCGKIPHEWPGAGVESKTQEKK